MTIVMAGFLIFLNAGAGGEGAGRQLLGPDGCAAVQRMGFTGVRTDLNWQDEWAMAVLMEFAAGEPCDGLKPLVVIHGNSPASVEERALFLFYAARDLGLSGFFVEIINESNITPPWEGRPELAAEAVARVISAWRVAGQDLDVTLLVGGANDQSIKNQGYTAAELHRLRELEPELPSNLVVGFHDYRPANKPMSFAFPPFVSRIMETDYFKAVLNVNGLSRRGCSEFGYDVTGKMSEAQVWERLKDSITYHKVSGAEFTTIYQLRNSHESTFGLVHEDGSLTVAGKNMKCFLEGLRK